MTNKPNDCVQVNLRITTNSNQGGRKYMEDAFAIALQRLNPNEKDSPISLAYFGIFDGHGGKEAAEFARQSLCQHILEQAEFWPEGTNESENDQSILTAIRKGFLACHNDMWNHVGKWAKTSSGLPSTSGSTASVCFIRGNKLYLGHVGDSAIVLAEGETLYKPWTANRLTRDHKPEDPAELNRIRESGGNVLCKAGVHRVVWNRQKSTSHSSHSYRYRHQNSVTTTTTTTTANGTTVEYEQIPFLAVSRALGDLWSLNASTNLYSVSPEPELTVIEIDSTKHRCVLLASDGLWNMITPEAAVEIVRNCDVKTEEMILKSEDDDNRPFRNPSHELVQRALALWRERMLRSDNITCVTVMLDPPGPPFSDCVVKKKKERLSYSMSSSTASVCSDDTVELDRLSPVPSATSMTTTTATSTATLQRRKPVLERKEHILTPISNGPTPMRTPKRRASEDGSTLLTDTPRRKLIKTNPQKENGRTSPTLTTSSSSLTETESVASPSLPALSSYLLPITSLDTEDDDPGSDSVFNTDEEHVGRRAEEYERDLPEQQSNDHALQTNPTSEMGDSASSSSPHRTRSRSTDLPAEPSGEQTFESESVSASEPNPISSNHTANSEPESTDH